MYFLFFIFLMWNQHMYELEKHCENAAVIHKSHFFSNGGFLTDLKCWCFMWLERIIKLTSDRLLQINQNDFKISTNKKVMITILLNQKTNL